jgi:RNA polymerase subunit RPABC4/transcription elongation factor Spt4
MDNAIGLTSLGQAFTVLTAFFGAFLAGLWLSLIFWTLRDIRTRSRDRLVHGLAAIVVAVLFLPGLVLYLILRPSRTLDEIYQETLEEEALLTEVEGRAHCPGCNAAIAPDWQVCAYCHTRLRKPCAACGQLLELPWQICPYCTSPVKQIAEDQTQFETTAN